MLTASQTQQMIACKVCGALSYHLCDTPNTHGAIPTIHHYRCKNCGLVFVGNQISNEQLGAAYATLDSTKYYEEITKTEERKFAKSLTNLQRLGVDRDTSLLDIGTGDGAFLLFLQKIGFQCLSGYEIPGTDTHILENGNIHIYKGYDYSSIPSDTFNVVTLLDVMEHVPDPRQTTQAVFRMLKPGGIIYFHTPMVTIIDRIMHKILSVPYLRKVGIAWQQARTSIFHLQNYTRISLDLLLRESGFVNISIDRENELSWPFMRYIRIYLCEKQGLPTFMSYVLAPFLYPLLATSLLNANKGIVKAKKPTG